MVKQEEEVTKHDHGSEEVSIFKASSAYLWQGFSGNLDLNTFDLFTNINVKDIAFGENHKLFLTEDGQVFVSGLNIMGQLGLGSLDIKTVEEPVKLGLPDLVTQISCGKNHSAIVTETGQVFCWGLSKDGQCGTGSLDLVLSPTQVIIEVTKGFCQHGVPRSTVPEVITGVACGASHTLAVSNIGEVWAWGCGPQLGLGDLRHAPIPRKIDILQGQTAVAVCCGARHSMALVIRGDKRSARSSSPWRSNRKTEAKSVLKNDLYPSRCAMCNKEIYTFTDTTDMCIIDTLHECDINDTLWRVDSTLVEDISSSSSSEMLKKSAIISPEKETTCIASTKQIPEGMLPDKLKKDTDDRNCDCTEPDGFLNDSGQLEACACDSSVLVVLSRSSFEGEDSHENVDNNDGTGTFTIQGNEDGTYVSTLQGNQDGKYASRLQGNQDGKYASTLQGNEDGTYASTLHGQKTLSTLSDTNRLIDDMSDASKSPQPLPASEDVTTDTTKARLAESSSEIAGREHAILYQERLPEDSVLDVNHQNDLQSGVEGNDNLTRDRTVSAESDEEIWKKRSLSEDMEEGELEQRKRSQSSVTSSIMSLNLSGAREYLQKQFEDEKEPDESSLESEKIGASLEKTPEAVQSETFPTSLSDMLDFSSSVLSQVKSVTSKALTNIQAFSVFSGSSSPAAGGNIQSDHAQIELSSLSGVTADGGQKKGDDSEFKAQSQVTRSGTFTEWTREMASVGDDLTSLTKDSDQRSLRTIEMQQKNLIQRSLSEKSDSSEAQSSRTRMVTATDVWVWGCNEHEQLGLGDQLERAQPTVIKLFVGRHVIKLAAGENHSLALTANSQVYSWGSNSYGQLGPVDVVHAPTRIKFMKGFTAWDIGSGADHSLFLGDSANGHQDVLYCGKHPSKGEHTSVKRTNSPVPLAEIRQLRWITKVMAGGTGCGCTVLNPAPPEVEPVFELAASERAFYNQLIKTSNLLLRPLQRSSFYTSMDVYPFKSSLQNLVTTFGALTKKIGEGITDLTRCIQNSVPLTHSLMLAFHSEFLEVFRSYSHSFSDFLAVGGFDYCTKTGSEFFEKIQGCVRDLSDERDKSVAASSLFLRAMRYPFFHLAEYSRTITRVVALVTNPETKSQLRGIVLAWDGLKISFTSEHKLADTTRVFWDSAFPKLTDTLRSPERRVLRDGKLYPLQMPSGGKFTSRIFVLFTDVFLMQSASVMMMLPLDTLWVESGTSDGDQTNMITLIAPEERLEVQAPTSAQKAEWLIALNSAISKVLTDQKSLPCKHGSGERFTPPLIRHAKHTFGKHVLYKDATYDGTWLSGRVHGAGTLKWPDGTVFEGHFKRGVMHGSGTFTIMKGKGREVQKGTWVDGKLNGLATVHYANGDLYEGYFQDGKRSGHGMYQSGHHKSAYASVYIGEWQQNLREGYGVQDDILKGEKYMGLWVEDQRYGSGVLVTLDGMYFEGNFVQNKLVGFGVMISDDNTLYEGDFMDITYLSGKGTLTLPTGDKLDGSFSGTLNEGLKVNGTFIKSATTPDYEMRSHPAGVKSKYFGRLGVQAEAKWTYIFSHISTVLGQASFRKSQNGEDTYKAWEVVAVMVTAGRNSLKSATGMSPSKLRVQQKTLEDLEKIPSHSITSLNTEIVEEITLYLSKACDSIYHPLGQLMETLVNVFRASYIGIGAHPRLLHHAVLEMKSYIRRLYKVIRILFPALPANGGPVHVYPPSKMGEIPRSTDEAKEFIEGLEIEDPSAMVLTSAGLLHPILLPKIYPPLFDLYALYNEKNDDQYWERVSKLNRQSDLGLMAYLGIEQRFWLMEDILQQDKMQKLPTIKDVCYAVAVDTLQQLSTAFSPLEKLKIIEQTFNEITKTVTLALKGDYLWCMDDLFPIFQFVVVRAKIRHLGAEIHMVDDLIEPHLEHGEFGLMFTTLKASYFQIQNEKMPHH